MSTTAPADVTSPDYPAYYVQLDVTTDDQALADQAVANLQAQYGPDWNPSDGNLEVVLIETLSPMAAQAAQNMANMTRAAFIALGTKLYGIAYQQGVPASTTVTLTFQDGNGPYLVPAGSELDLGGYAFQTVLDATCPNGQTRLTGQQVVANDVGTAFNDLTDANWQNVTLPVWVTNVTTEAPTSGGVDPQDDTDYLNLVSREMQLRGRIVVTLPDYEIAAVDTAGIGRAYAQADTARNVTVTLTDDQGNPVSAALKQTLSDLYAAERLVNVTVTLADATYTAINVTYSVAALQGFDTGQLVQSINTNLSQVLSPMGWGAVVYGQAGGGPTTWVNDPVVRLNKMITVVGATPGVKYVVSLTIGGAYAAKLSSTLSTAAAITSLPITAAGLNTIPSGATITLTSSDGQYTQTWVTTAAVAPAATSIPVQSQTPNYAYTAAATISGPVTGDFTMPGTVPLPKPGTFTGTATVT
jgi:hypothetical protein